MSERLSRTVYGALQTVSFILVLKGAVGGSLAMLALFGVAVPILGIDPNAINQGGAAATGAVLGIIAALRA